MGCHKFKHSQSISVASRVIACRQNTAQTMNPLQIVDLHCCRKPWIRWICIAIETVQIMDPALPSKQHKSWIRTAVEIQRKSWIRYKSLPSKHSAKYEPITNHGFVTNQCRRNTAQSSMDLLQTMDSLQIIAVETQRKVWIRYKPWIRYQSWICIAIAGRSMLSSNRVNAGVECCEYKRRAVNYDVISYTKVGI